MSWADGLAVPLESWTHDGATCLIDTEVGLRLWQAARDARDLRAVAARRVADSDAVIRAIIGDTDSLVTLDGRALAMLVRRTRRHLDRERLQADTGIRLSDYEELLPLSQLEIAASIEEQH